MNAAHEVLAVLDRVSSDDAWAPVAFDAALIIRDLMSDDKRVATALNVRVYQLQTRIAQLEDGIVTLNREVYALRENRDARADAVLVDENARLHRRLGSALRDAHVLKEQLKRRQAKAVPA